MRLTLLLFMACCSAGYGQEISGWTLKKDENGIKVYTRTVEDTSFSELKMNTVFETSMSAIIALFKDVPNYAAWVYLCSLSETVMHGNELEDYYYSVTSAPWPMSDRDVVVHSKVSQDTGNWVVTSVSRNVDGLREEHEGVVRLPHLKSEWTLVPLADGRVDVTYFLSVHPGGLIPSWLANLTLTIGPYHTMLGLISEVQKERYKNARFDFIYEPFLSD